MEEILKVDSLTMNDEKSEIEYINYESELQMPDIMRLIQKDLSEPYSIYTYRYFIHNWPQLCFLVSKLLSFVLVFNIIALSLSLSLFLFIHWKAIHKRKVVGAIVCKLDLKIKSAKSVRRGYIAMLAVDENFRNQRIGSNLVLHAIGAMVKGDADEVVLETEITNRSALNLYENLGFIRDKRLFRYYLNGVDALRLKLWLE